MTGHLVGLDLGSQSAKVEVLDAAGRVLAGATQALRPTERPGPGLVEHPGDDLWEASAAALRAALAAYDAAGHDRRGLAGLGLCGIRNCRVELAADGGLAAPVQSWMDARVGRAWEPRPEVAWVAASSAHLTARLTGEVRDSVAAYRGLWPSDVARWAWTDDPDRLAECGIPADRLVPLALPGEVLGRVTAGAAGVTGLPEGLPVVATANDKAVEALGAGLSDPDDVLVSLGTYVAGMVTGDGPGEPPGGWTNFAAVPGRWLHESTGVRRGMWTVSWVAGLVGGDVADLDARAADLPAGADGLLAVPDWLAPVDEPHRRGAFVGFDDRHGPPHLLRAVLEGMAAVLADHVDDLLAGLPGRGRGRLLLSGGGARSAVARQCFAGAFDRPLVVPGGGSPAARGAAVCAAVGTGVHDGWDAAVAAMVPGGADGGEPHRVDEGARAAYAELRERHRDLRAALDPVLRRAHGG